MSAATTTTPPFRSAAPAGRDGFPQLLRAEWTKFRTVRGWVVAAVTAAVVLVLFGLVNATGSHRACGGPNGAVACPRAPIGPEGGAVTDVFHFVHQPLRGDGSITVRVTSLTGGSGGLQPWAKAGVIVKDGLKAGSAYAALAVSGAHGVRWQYDYTHDVAGSPGAVGAASPRWLRLTRRGDTLTGYDSADGEHWTRVGTARLAGLPETVRIGLFAASPEALSVQTGGPGGSSGSADGPTVARAVMDRVSLRGAGLGDSWTGTDVGGDGRGRPVDSGGYRPAGGVFAISGSGDIAPTVAGPAGGGTTAERSLVGAFAGLILVTVLGALFISAEYRRGLIRTTLAASPRRGRVLAAKAVVVGAVGFLAGLAGSAVAIELCGAVLRANGNDVLPVSGLTQFRLVAGTAGLLAVCAVLALAAGTVLRRGAGAVTAVVALVVLPYILATASVLPAGPSEWLMRITPAAGFAIQQSIPAYHQVSSVYTPSNGYFPLPPWGGFAVLCGWAAGALLLAGYLLRRRDV